MDKRYQVFVSSTYDDLREERAEVMQALLELDCIPAGMELFPAANSEQWDWIKRVIDESDYYLVVSAGRYGRSPPKKDFSYTELEYRYAMETEKPTIAFLHEDLGQIAASKSEKSEEGRARLEAFRSLCEKKLCKYWRTPSDLGAKVSRGVSKLVRDNPAVGWVRSNFTDPSVMNSIMELQKENVRLREQLLSQNSLEDTASDFADGDYEYTIEFFAEVSKSRINKSGRIYWVSAGHTWQSISLSWNEILIILSHVLLIEPMEDNVAAALNNSFWEKIDLETIKDEIVKEEGEDTEGERGDEPLERSSFELRLDRVKITTPCLLQIRTQLHALGIVISTKENYGTKWELTEKGRRIVLELTAIKKID